MNTKRYIVGLGEVLWDMLPEGRKLGGAPSNFAYHAGQFLGSDNTLAVSAIGKDRLAAETLETLKQKKLNFIMPAVDFPTGTVLVDLDSNGVPVYDIRKNVAWDNIPFTPEIQEVAKNCRAVCFGTLAQRSAVSFSTIQGFLDITPDDCLKIYDINLRQNFYNKETIEKSLNRCNILKINDEELAVVSRLFGLQDINTQSKCLQIVKDYNLDMLVLTCGVNGSYVFSADLISFQETPKVKVADTVGAGDSFTGSFCASLLHGKTINEAHKTAVKVSAYVCTQNGAMPEIDVKVFS